MTKLNDFIERLESDIKRIEDSNGTESCNYAYKYGRLISAIQSNILRYKVNQR
jgi:hypothetical protein